MTATATFTATAEELQLLSDAVITELCRVAAAEGQECPKLATLKALQIRIAERLELCDAVQRLAA